MLIPAQRQRFHALRDRQDAGEVLTAQEQSELTDILRQWDEAEAEAMAPALKSMDEENARLRERLAALTSLAEREDRYLTRLRTIVEDLRAERQAIEAERARLTAA